MTISTEAWVDRDLEEKGVPVERGVVNRQGPRCMILRVYMRIGAPVNENLPGCLGVGGSSSHLTNCSGTSGVHGNEHYAVYWFVCYTLSSAVVVVRYDQD